MQKSYSGFSLKDNPQMLIAIVPVVILMVVMITVTILLSSCKTESPVADGGEVAAEKSAPQMWEYQVLEANCRQDKGSKVLYCVKLEDKDETTLEGVLVGEAKRGWEMASILRNENIYSFVFKREYKH